MSTFDPTLGRLNTFYEETLLSRSHEPNPTRTSPSPIDNSDDLDCLDLLGLSGHTTPSDCLSPKASNAASKPSTPHNSFRPIAKPKESKPNLAEEIAKKFRFIRQAIRTGKATDITMESLDVLAVQIRALKADAPDHEKSLEFRKILEELFDVINMTHVEAAPTTPAKPAIKPTWSRGTRGFIEYALSMGYIKV